MTIKQLVDRLAKDKPRTGEQLLDLGLPLKRIDGDNGSYRTVYEIIGKGLVIKLPHRINGRIAQSRIRHARLEWESYYKALNDDKLKALRKYLPKIYFFDYSTGLTMMKLYRLAGTTKCMEEMRKNLEDEVKGIVDVENPDIDNSGNVGFDEKGRIKIIDLGWLSGY